jgi:putative endonuclease
VDRHRFDVRFNKIERAMITASDQPMRQTRLMRKAKSFYVYIMTNRTRSHVLYTGVTGNLPRRVLEHKNKLAECFTSRYNLTRLVYYEHFSYPDAAIDREKEIKGWRRNRKLALVESMNPSWYDLAAEWQDVYKPVDRTPARPTPDPSARWIERERSG